MQKARLICSLIFVICAGAMFAPTMAQQPQPVQPPQAVEIKLNVTMPELDIISEGLQLLPFGKVAPLFNKLRQQVMDQQKPVDKKD